MSIISINTPDPEPTITQAMLAAGIGITNLAAVKVADPAVQAAVAYLEGLGAPAPYSQVDEFEAFPGGSYTYSKVTWMNPTTGQQVAAEAGILALRPNILTTQLAQIGLLPLSGEVDGNSLAPYQVAAAMPQPHGAPVVIVFPTSPIGSPIYEGWDTVGARFQPSTTDSLGSHPIGSKWKNLTASAAPVGTYIKIGAVNPFGASVMWQRTA